MRIPIEQAVCFLRAAFPEPIPRIAIVLGSGLSELGDELEASKVVRTSDVPNWPLSTVSGHPGRLTVGGMDGERVLVQQGRVHFYEGYPIQQVVFPIRVFAALGIRRLILTNAAGGIRPDFQPGDLMLVIDQINWMGTNPLIGPNDPNWGLRFPDMSSVYDPEWIRLAETVGTELGIQLRKGVLAGTSGPSYETAAEIRMLKQIGADAVTMSTIPEAITAVQMGIRVLGISFISNYATGVSTQKLSHTEVEETARSHRNRFKTLVRNTAVRIVRSA